MESAPPGLRQGIVTAQLSLWAAMGGGKEVRVAEMWRQAPADLLGWVWVG